MQQLVLAVDVELVECWRVTVGRRSVDAELDEVQLRYEENQGMSHDAVVDHHAVHHVPTREISLAALRCCAGSEHALPAIHAQAPVPPAPHTTIPSI